MMRRGVAHPGSEAQTRPQAPQLRASMDVLVSQPLVLLPSQLPHPVVQVGAHVPQSAAQVPHNSPLSQRPLPQVGPAGGGVTQRPAVQS
jgi:hypothetical protein